MLQWWFTKSPPSVIHTEQSISTLKTNRCEIHTESQCCGSQDAFFRSEMWLRVGRTGGRSDASPGTSDVLFSSYKLPKTVTTLLLFGPVTLLCGTFLFIKLSEGPVLLSDCQTLICAVGLSIHTGLVANTAPLILPQEAYQCMSEISPLAASKRFTQ